MIYDLDKKPENYYIHSRKEMLKFIPPNITKVLDVGCGDGHFGKILKTSFSAEVWGIENYKQAAEKAKTMLDNVLTGDIERGEIILPDDYFDCIVFNDVLEHLQYPWIVLKNIRKNLKQEGFVVASIPNVRYYQNIKDLVLYGKWKYVEAGILDKTHLRFFTFNSIIDMFEGCGYDIVILEGINGDQFPWKFGLLNRILFNSLDDMRYLQFVCVVKKKE